MPNAELTSMSVVNTFVYRLVKRTVKISYLFNNGFTIRFGSHDYSWRGTDKQIIEKANKEWKQKNSSSITKIEASGRVLWEYV